MVERELWAATVSARCVDKEEKAVDMGSARQNHCTASVWDFNLMF